MAGAEEAVADVTIVDVAPRDGLQNEPRPLGVAERVALIRHLAAAGVPRIEVGAFVSPQRVPQMAGTEAVCAALPPGPAYTALVPNRRGYERARTTALRHLRLVVAASETFNRRNTRTTIDAALDDFARIAEQARADGIALGGAVATAFGCPYEGPVPPAAVRRVVAALVRLGVDEVVLADTIGVAVPTQVAALLREVGRDLPPGVRLGIHLHNTRNTGFANAYAALTEGVRLFDAALGGIGGCPFAPRATGNIATEDLVYMFERMGVRTGIDLAALLRAVAWLEEALGHPVPGLVAKAGPAAVPA